MDAMFFFRRSAIGWSVNEAADALGVDVRTVQRWDAGTSQPPPGVWLHLDQVDDARRDTVDLLLETVEQMASDYTAGDGDPQVFTWVVYRSAADARAVGADLGDLGVGGHVKMFTDAVEAAVAAELPVELRVMWMDPPAFRRWLGGRAATAATRAEWAARQELDGQAVQPLYGAPTRRVVR